MKGTENYWEVSGAQGLKAHLSQGETPQAWSQRRETPNLLKYDKLWENLYSSILFQLTWGRIDYCNKILQIYLFFLLPLFLNSPVMKNKVSLSFLISPYTSSSSDLSTFPTHLRTLRIWHSEPGILLIFFLKNYSKTIKNFFFHPTHSVPSQFFCVPADFMALEIDILWPIIAFLLPQWSLLLASNHLTFSTTLVSSSFLYIIILVHEKRFSCFAGSVLCLCSEILSSLLTSPCNFKFPKALISI